jgi:hypothetical protein
MRFRQLVYEGDQQCIHLFVIAKAGRCWGKFEGFFHDDGRDHIYSKFTLEILC